MKLLFSITNLGDGGAQTFVARLSSRLSRDHDIFLFSLDDSSFPSVDGLLAPSVKTLSLLLKRPSISRSLRRVGKILSYFGCPFDFYQSLLAINLAIAVRWLRIEVISSHLYHSDKFVALIPFWLSPPRHVTDHGDYAYVLDNGIATINDLELIFRSTTSFIGVSQVNVDRINGLSRRLHRPIHSVKIYNGYELPVDLRLDDEYLCSSLGLSQDAFIFGMVARGIEEKGWAEALAAFRYLVENVGFSPHLVFVGDSAYLQDLRHQVPASCSSNVHFVGFSNNPIEWIFCFDVALLPTYFPGESLPCAVIEYLSVGKPVVATDIGGIRDMLTVHDSIAGHLIPLSADRRPCVDAIASAMHAYCKDSSLLDYHSSLAKHAYAKFDMNACVDSYLNVFSGHA